MNNGSATLLGILIKSRSLEEKTWELIKQSPFIVGKDWTKSDREAMECLIKYPTVEMGSRPLVIFQAVHKEHFNWLKDRES